MITALRRLLLKLAYPFLKGASGIHMPFTHKKITGRDYYAIRNRLRPGTIFVTKIYGELTGLIIPGKYSHAAIYCPVQMSPDEMVMEAEGEGVIQTDLVSFIMGKDKILVLDPGLPDEVMFRAAEIATEQLGDPYDYSFEFHISGQRAFYCSELVWWSYEKACAEFKVESPFKPRLTLGVPTVTPDDIANTMMKVWEA